MTFLFKSLFILIHYSQIVNKYTPHFFVILSNNFILKLLRKPTLFRNESFYVLYGEKGVKFRKITLKLCKAVLKPEYAN